MRKYVLILIALVFSAFVAGCGTERSTSESESGIKPVDIQTTDFVNANTTIATTLVLRSVKPGQADIQLDNPNNTGTGTVTGALTGTWTLTPALLADKITTKQSIQISVNAIPVKTLACIQKEPTNNYLLVYDIATNEISRLYLNPTAAAAFDPTKMGGAIQGTPLNLTTQVSTFAGSPAGTLPVAFGNQNDKGIAATFNRPMDITTDGLNFYVTDKENHLIRKITKDGIVSTFAGTGVAGSSDNPTGTLASFNHPRGITTDGTNLYVTDSDNHAIRMIAISTGAVTTIAGTVGSAGTFDDTGLNASFNTPIGITTDGTNLYVADTGNNTIRKVVLSSHKVSTIAGNIASADRTDGTSVKARFDSPTFLTTDGSNLYVTDFNNRAIRRVVIATGEVDTFAGNSDPDAPIGAVETTDTTAGTFNHPDGITTDGTNLYVTDFNSTPDKSGNWVRQVRKVDIATKAVSTLAGGASPSLDSGGGTLAPVSKDGSGIDARFATPFGITTDGSALYIADFSITNGNNIRKVQ